MPKLPPPKPKLRAIHRPPFLEWLAELYLGDKPCNPPYYWCPFCFGKKTLLIKRPNDNDEVKFRCMKCRTWGDEVELILWCEIIEDDDVDVLRQKLATRLRELRAQYIAEFT